MQILYPFLFYFTYLALTSCLGFFRKDDTRILLAKPDVGNLLDTLQTQQQQFMGLPDQIAMEPTIPITFTKVGNIYSIVGLHPRTGIPTGRDREAT